MSALTRQQQLSAPVWVINKRLNHHTRKRIDSSDNIILEGLTFRKLSGKVHRTGKKDYPYLRSSNVEVSESIFAGAKSGDGKRMNTAIASVITLDFMLVCDTDLGLVTEDDSTLGAIDWIGKVCDAIETDENNQADASLEGTLATPVSFSIREPETTSSGYEVIIEVILNVRPVCRGERHYTVPPA